MGRQTGKKKNNKLLNFLVIFLNNNISTAQFIYSLHIANIAKFQILIFFQVISLPKEKSRHKKSKFTVLKYLTGPDYRRVFVEAELNYQKDF